MRSGVTLADDVSQIGAAKAGDVFVGVTEAELLDDIVADALSGAGGEGDNGEVGKKFAEAAKLAILGAEVVAPFGDAMGFVDGEEGNRHAAEPGGRAVEGDAFRRKIEKAVVALAGAAKDETALVARERAIEKSGGDAHLFELRDLVLHQGDQWRNNYHGAPPVEDRGQLVAERLATTRGHHYASVASRSDAPDNVLLAWAERFVAPIAAQGLGKRRGAFRRVVLFGHRRPQSCHGSLSGPRSGPSAMQQGQHDGGCNIRLCFVICQM